MQRACIFLAFVLGLVRGSEEWDTNKGAPLRSNVVLLLVDDVGYGDIDYGDGTHTSPARTPQLTAMARGPNTVHFQRFYCGGAVCSPSRSSMLTGRSPTRECIINVEHNALPPTMAARTTAAYARTAGYTTGFFGKWHVGSLTSARDPDCQPRPASGCTPGYILINDTLCCDGRDAHVPVMRPTDTGFDTALATPQVAASATANCGCVGTVPGAGEGCELGHYRGMGHVPANEPWLECNQYFESTADGNMVSVQRVTPVNDAAFLVDNFLAFAQAAIARGQPFFAQVSFHNNHIPYIAPPEYRALYPGHPENMQDYYGSLTAVDDQVGRIRTFLRTAGVANNTFLAFTSDNGPEDNVADHECAPFVNPGNVQGRLGRKRTLTEGGIRMPGLVEFPPLVHQNRVDRGLFPATTNDFLPTLLDIAGVSQRTPTIPIDGVSLLPMLAGNVTKRTVPLGWYSAYPWLIRPPTTDPPPPQTCQQRPWHRLPKAFPPNYSAPFGQHQIAWSEGPYKLFACNANPNNSTNWRFSLFDVVADDKEKIDLWPTLGATIGETLFEHFLVWQASVLHSITVENNCTVPLSAEAPRSDPWRD